MPRYPRNYSRSGYSHVIVRGAGKQIIFEDVRDFKKYLALLQDHSGECNVSIIAYCLMSNHVHLLLHDPDRNLSDMMKAIGISYAAYYNKRYEHSGHVFQGRFMSIGVENDAALLNVIRYILQNPAKAGICPVEAYAWSSYADCIRGGGFTDCSRVIELAGGEKSFREYVHADGNDEENALFEYGKKDDRWALLVIHRVLAGKSGTSLKEMDRPERDDCLMRLLQAGLSARQIERLTGVNKGAIDYAKKKRP